MTPTKLLTSFAVIILLHTPLTAQALVLNPIKDTFVRAGAYADDNFGTSNQLVVKNEGPSHNNTRESWIGFDLQEVDGWVTQATLRVFLKQANGTTTHLAYPAGSDWSETQMTWNNQADSYSPALDQASLSGSDAESWIDYDVTSWVAERAFSAETEVAFIISANDSEYSVYDARETSNKPQLLITTDSIVVHSNYSDLQFALDNAQPGDVIYFTGNIYGMPTTQADGTSSQPITLRGLGNATIHGSGVSASAYGVLCEHDWYIFEDFTITNARKGFVAQYSADNGIIRNVTVDTVGDEAFKFRWNTNHWLVENCVARNTGNRTGSYGEGYYVGNAENNWISPTTPDTSGYITFLNCLAENLTNDGFDIKEGSSHVKMIGCIVDFSSGQPTGGASQGDSGFYLRAENIQIIDCLVIGQSNGGAAIKLERKNNASDGNSYGSNYFILGAQIQQTSGGSALLTVKNQQAVRESSFLYDNYELNGGNLYTSVSSTINIIPHFEEMTWSGPGGDTYHP